MALFYLSLSWAPSSNQAKSPPWWSSNPTGFESLGRKGNKRQDSAHQSALPCSRPWTYLTPLNTASQCRYTDLALIFKASQRKRGKRGEKERTATRETERRGGRIGGVVERHTAGLHLKYCTSSTVFTSHGLLKSLYCVTLPSIIRLFSCNQIGACTHTG